MRLVFLHACVVLVVGCGQPEPGPRLSFQQDEALPALDSDTPLVSEPDRQEPQGDRGARVLGRTVSTDSLEGEGFAVLVGIDGYAHLPPLQYCSHDMEALAETLIDFGGFAQENVVLLTNQSNQLSHKPTPSNIRAAIGMFSERAKPTDTILFAFAGHGTLQDGRTYLLPFDANPAEEFSDANTVSMKAVHEQLRRSNAKTKIVILDCCHAGGDRSSTDTSSSFLEFIPRNVGFVELLSSGPNQKSRECDILKHGLFTYFLIDGIRTGKADSDRDGLVSVHEALDYVRGGIDLLVRTDSRFAGHRQEPRIRAPEYLGQINLAKAGSVELHPKEGEISSINDAETLAVAFATFPGLTGRQWWFEEVPWMLPELRREPRHLPEQVIAHRPIDGQPSLDANMLATLDPASLRKVLYSSFERYHEELRARELQLRRAGMVASLEEDIRESVADPAKQDELLAEIRSLGDLHLLALVQHRFKRPEAESTYRDALQQYETEKTPLRDCLYALCWADLGRVQADNNAWRESASSFRRARNQVGGLGPQAATFRVSARLREIWATRKVARTRDDWSKLNEAMTEAFREADESQLPQSHWLYACLHEERAWLFMEQWMVTEAKQNFERARLIREEAMGIADAKDKPTLQMACFHNEHGHAMASLFSGEVDAAKLAYEEVFSNMEQLRERSDSASRDEDVIIRRLHNTAERLGDLYLLSMRPQPAKALHWYAGSLEYARLLTSGDTKTPQVKLLYKRAIAASLEGRFEVAVEAISSAGAIELGDNQQKECEVFRRVAEACRRLATKEQAEVELARRDLREILNAAVPGRTTEASQGGGLARGYDSLTFLMFAWGRLIDSRRADDPQGADDPDLLSDAALLFRICPERLSDPAAFRHFKPYHDVAIVLRTTAESVEDPADVVCHIWLANTGGFPVWPQRNSQLLFHYPASMDQPNFAVLYRPDQSPAAAFRRFVLAESEADVDKAVRQNAELSLPDSLRDALQMMESEVLVVWPPCLGTCPYSVPGKSKVSP